jgi:hypothetical protein
MTPLALSEWRDFYVMIGTASGALVARPSSWSR